MSVALTRGSGYLASSRKESPMDKSQLVEELAEMAHASRSRWMEYLFSLCEIKSDGSLVIPASSVRRWRDLCDTAYGDLPDKLKQHDRNEVTYIISIIEEYYNEKID